MGGDWAAGRGRSSYPSAPLRPVSPAVLPPTDAAFDALLPAPLRPHARQHFTPLADALLVGAWLDELGIASLCDVGAGAGKLCVLAALAAPRCAFVGLERRASLVEVARGLAVHFGVEGRVTFVEGSLGEAPLPVAAAYYLFNPFGENLLPTSERIDERVDHSDARYERDVAAAEAWLATAPAGTWLLTYEGFGGKVPRDFEELRAARCTWGALRLWRRA